MNNKVLGQKIKDHRKALNLTQTQLAGKKITRNMLSRIESGAATPSIDTLEHIAKGLKLPLAYLVSDDNDFTYYAKKETIDRIYRAYSAKNYDSVLKLIENISTPDNELAYLATVSAMQTVKNSIKQGSLLKANKYLHLAQSYSEKTIIDTSHIIHAIPLYRAIIENVQSPLLYYDPSDFITNLPALDDFEFFKYLTLDFDYKFKNAAYALHLKAKSLIKEKDYKSAADTLLEAVEIVKRDDYNAFIIFGLYNDLEQCYKNLFDFENAYAYSAKRFSLVEGFKS